MICSLFRADLIAGARACILEEWKREMNRTLGATQHRLSKLNQEKIQETSQLVSKNSRPQQIIAAGYNLEDKKEISTLVDLKALMRDLDGLYNMYSIKKGNRSKVPVYNNLVGLSKKMCQTSHFDLWKPICSLLSMIDFPARRAITYKEKEEEMLDILKDFTVDHRSRKSLISEWENTFQKKEMSVKIKKEVKGRRGSNSTQRMLERRERRKFALKEFESKGKKHFLVVRKQVENFENAEDIFSDWKANLAKTKIKKQRAKKQTNRALRKDLIKSSISKDFRPKTYSEAVQKNLKRTEQPAAEEIFEYFTRYLEELNLVLETPGSVKVEDMADIFHPFRHNFHVPEDRLEDIDILVSTTCIPSLDMFQCGTTTIKTFPKVSAESPKKTSSKNASFIAAEAKRQAAFKTSSKKPSKTVVKVLASGKANVSGKENKPEIPVPHPPVKKMELETDRSENPEESVLEVHKESKPLKEFKKNKISQGTKPMEQGYEVIFQDWIFNLQEPQMKTLSKKIPKPQSQPEKLHLDDGFQDYKDSLRQDFDKIVKIKDKKRSQAERRSTGRKIK